MGSNPDRPTERIPPADATPPIRPFSPDATRVNPPGPDPRWSARANVPTPTPYDVEPDPTDPYDGRAWYRPAVIGIVVFLLVAAIAVGGYLIYRSDQRAAPATSATPVVTAAPSPAPSSVAPPSPSASPTARSEPATVAVPVLRGQSEQSARDQLTQLGLQVQVQPGDDSTIAPGHVIGTNPLAGSELSAGSTIVLIVEPAASASASASVVPS